MWINSEGQIYLGDCALGDRAATQAEIDAWEAARVPMFTKVYKANIWRATTSAEADQLDALLKAQGAKFRRLFEDSLYLDINDDLFKNMLKPAVVALLGQTRADEILQATE